MASTNPLFEPQDKPADKDKANGYILPSNKKVVEPSEHTKDQQAAANMVRQKLATLYAEEPSAKKELDEIEHSKPPLSKHQQFLSNLHQNMKSAAEIQVKWHEYYTSLPDTEKREVWQEFYTEQAKYSRYAEFMNQSQKAAPAKPVVRHHEVATPSAAHKRLRDARSSSEVKEGIRRKVAKREKRQAPHPLQSIFFGLATGAAVLLILLFGLFNEVVIAPFIQPSRNVSATPIILDNDAIAADGATKIIIPKINVEIPVDYSLASMDESVIQKGLEGGVVHYPSTTLPGEQGNAAFFGHSSNNIFNPGKYKFAFVLLNNLQPGDTFYLTYNKKVYAYKVFDKKIVNPDDVWILNPVAGKTATATLITCDPPGTTLHRLAVWGEQISPDPASNAVAGATNQPAPQEIPAVNESLWGRITSIF